MLGAFLFIGMEMIATTRDRPKRNERIKEIGEKNDRKRIRELLKSNRTKDTRSIEEGRAVD